MEEIDRLVEQNRRQLQQTFTHKHNELISATEVFKHTLTMCKDRGWKTHAELWNLGIYINIAAHDLSVLVMQLHFEREVWVRKQIARHVVLAIYEIAEDMTQLLGGRMRKALESLTLLSRFNADLRAARQPLDHFWKQHQKKLSDLRCKSAAHRELDGLALLESIESIDVLEIAKRGLEMGQILDDIATVVQAIIEKCSTIPPPEMKTHTTSGLL